MSSLLLTFYGDDFTGSTDSMETLEWGGIPTVLFLEPPDETLVREHFPDVRVIGVAGVSRSLSPAQMDDALPPIFEAVRALGAPAFHYKVCSTFDSSPTLGSIGRATEIGLHIFGDQLVPLVVGAPFLRRYVAFSNLFARVDDVTYRLDRHPTMSKHPATPMNEADLRLHLGRQINRQIASLNLLHLTQPLEALRGSLKALREDGAEIVVFDTLDDTHLRTIGNLLDDLREEAAAKGETLLIVGSSGVEKALALHWQDSGVTSLPAPPESPGAVNQLIVISGSAAPATAAQIEWAEANGFAVVRLDTIQLMDSATAESARTAAVELALEQIRAGRSIVLYTAYGPEDPHIARTREHLAALSLDPASVSGRLGTQLGLILKALLEQTGLRRAVVCGGDTCGYAARQLGIYALSAIYPVAPGAPLCRAHSHDLAFDGLLIALKAGQVGKPDFFGSILSGIA